jgi:NADH-quinone oxidoreductase subunit K
MSPLQICLIGSSLLFCIGLAGVLARSHAIIVLLGIELMLNAANLNFIAFWRFGGAQEAISGLVFAIFSIAIAAAEAAVGLALIIALHRHRRSIRLQVANQLKG